MSHHLKVVVTGLFNAGKTRFVKTLSDIDVVSTERRITLIPRRDSAALRAGPGRSPQGDRSKTETTVAMDYGRVQLGEAVVHLHGTPGQARFDFMWEILAREMAGLVFLVDATAPDSYPDARDLLEFFTASYRVPHVVAANKQDADGAARPEALRRALHLPASTLIMPCVASRKTSAKQVLAQLVELIGAR
jgi:hypothetical protein